MDGPGWTSNMLDMNQKWCPKCQSEKGAECFHKNRTRQDGIAEWCKDCTNARKRANYDPIWRKLYYQNHKEHIAGTSKVWYENNRDRTLEIASQWRQNNPLKRREYERRRVALKRNTQIDPIHYEEILERDGLLCHLCNTEIDDALSWPDPHSLSFDHVVPLALEGSHTADNIKPSHLRCNLQRPRKFIEDDYCLS